MEAAEKGNLEEVETFIDQWPESANGCQAVFSRLYDFLKRLSGTRIEFHARPGITYSLRGIPEDNGNFPLFVMIDVIDDHPRWLSVCFYERLVNDDECRGDIVPGGLLGEDGLCFDIESEDEEMVHYLQQLIAEACAAVTE
jgi:hypothetical protein